MIPLRIDDYTVKGQGIFHLYSQIMQCMFTASEKYTLAKEQAYEIQREESCCYIIIWIGFYNDIDDLLVLEYSTKMT